MRRLTLLLTVVVLVSAAGSTVGAGGSSGRQWRVRDLGTLPGDATSQPVALNERGEIVGNSSGLSTLSRAFLWRDRRMIDLGTLGGTSSWARAINNRGQVVGSSLTRSGLRHAFLWKNGRMIDLGTLPGGLVSDAVAVNDRGEVVGSSSTRKTQRAVLWRQRRIIDLGTLGGTQSAAVDINESDQIVGWSRLRTNIEGRRVRDWRPAQHAFLWNRGRMTDLRSPQDLPFGRAIAINDRGQVIGSASWERADAGPRGEAVLWENGRLTVLRKLPGHPPAGLLHSYADALNDRGQIVGAGQVGNATHAMLWDALPGLRVTDLGARDSGNSDAQSLNERGEIVGLRWVGRHAHAVIWQNGSMTDLGTLLGPATDSQTLAINNHSQIVGQSSTGNGQPHAVLWTPKTGN